MAFSNARNTTIYGGTFTEIHGYNYNIGGVTIGGPEPGLLALYNATSPSAAFNSQERHPPPKCHPGTRKKLLKQIIDWVGGGLDDCGRVLWLHGPAGSGKSAIAQTVAEDCAQCGVLAATFFFSRGQAGRDSIDRLFSTIAYQLSISIPQSRPTIQQNINNDPSIVCMNISVQLDRLIIQPLQSINAPSPDTQPRSQPLPSLVIIDGLDECAGRDVQSLILGHILRLVNVAGLPLRFLIVSRPEAHIQHAFEKTDLVKYSSAPISLYGLYQSREDVRTYLLHEFKRIHSSEKHEVWMDSVPKPWPTLLNLNLLVQQCAGYFVYAVTLIRFVDQEFISPPKQLDIILNISSSGFETFGELDKLYLHVLSTHPDANIVKNVLGAILGRVPQALIPELLHVQQGLVSMVLRSLRSVIQIGSDDIPRPTHASFSDFIFDPTRAGKFHIDEQSNWSKITRAMLGHLKCRPSSSVQSLLTTNRHHPLFKMTQHAYQNWFYCFMRAGTHRSALAEEIMQMEPSHWIILPHDDWRIPWHDELFSDVKLSYVDGMEMLLNIWKGIKNDPDIQAHHPALIQYFAMLLNTALNHLLAPLCPQDSWIVHGFTSFIWQFIQRPFVSILEGAMLIQSLLGLEHPMPYRSLQIFELLKAFGDKEPMTCGTLPDLKKYLASREAPRKLFIDPKISHAYLAHRCMTLLTTSTNYVLAPPELDENKSHYQYARLHWAEHLQNACVGNDKLLHHLRTIKRRCFFDSDYFSGSVSGLEAQIKKKFPTDIRGRIEARIELQRKRFGETTQLHMFIGRLGNFCHNNHGLSLAGSRSHAVTVVLRRGFLEDDVQKAQKVLSWLKKHRHPPDDLVQQWEKYHDELRTALIESTQERNNIEWDGEPDEDDAGPSKRQKIEQKSTSHPGSTQKRVTAIDGG